MAQKHTHTNTCIQNKLLYSITLINLFVFLICRQFLNWWDSFAVKWDFLCCCFFFVRRVEWMSIMRSNSSSFTPLRNGLLIWYAMLEYPNKRFDVAIFIDILAAFFFFRVQSTQWSNEWQWYYLWWIWKQMTWVICWIWLMNSS